MKNLNLLLLVVIFGAFTPFHSVFADTEGDPEPNTAKIVPPTFCSEINQTIVEDLIDKVADMKSLSNDLNMPEALDIEMKSFIKNLRRLPHLGTKEYKPASDDFHAFVLSAETFRQWFYENSPAPVELYNRLRSLWPLIMEISLTCGKELDPWDDIEIVDNTLPPEPEPQPQQPEQPLPPPPPAPPMEQVQVIFYPPQFIQQEVQCFPPPEFRNNRPCWFP